MLKVGYDRLSKKNQSLFLHIACFFNNEVDGHVKSVLSDSNLDVGNGLKTLADKSLVHISTNGQIVMHHLLQQLGKEVVLGQSDEPGKRQFLIEAEEIRDVLTNETGTGSVIGISFNTSNIGEVSVSKGAFEGMRNLRFLRIYRGWRGGTLQIPKDMNYLPHLRLLHWDHYPRKTLPSRFNPEHLVEIDIQYSNLKKLWGGIQPLPNLKLLDLSFSYRLKEIPNLSKATNLETLELVACTSLVELPSSISNLHKLSKLKMWSCEKLRVIPTNINLASLEGVDMSNCSRLRSFPDISSNIKTLGLRNTKIEDVPPSIVGCWSRLECLKIGSRILKRLTHAPQSITSLDLSNSDIKMIPDCVISLPHLVDLNVENCPKLLTIPTLSPSLKSLNANDCVSLKRVCFSFQNSSKKLTFYNCLKLDEEARRGIIQQRVSDYIWLPGKKIPAEFTHKATGKSITIPLAPGTFSASSRFKACCLILPSHLYNAIRCSLRSKGGVTVHSCYLEPLSDRSPQSEHLISPDKGWPFKTISCRLRSKGGVTISSCYLKPLSDQSPHQSPRSEHLFIFHGDLFPLQSRCHEVDVTMSEIIFEFSCNSTDDKIIECGVHIMTDEAEGSSNSEVDNFETESSSIEVDYYGTGGNNNHHTDGDYEAEVFKFSQDENIETSKHTGFWSWLRRLGRKEKKMNETERNSCGIP